MPITIAVIQFPGSNCERETIQAVQRSGMQAEAFLWNQSPDTLKKYHGYIIVGGFSYEDRARAGIIAALDPIIATLREETVLGKPLLGICNGAQILIESGLVPGTEKQQTLLALGHNHRVQNGNILGTGYYNAWVHIKAHRRAHAFNQRLNQQTPLCIPIAHAEGRYIISDELLQALQDNGQIAFQYCDAKGAIKNEFPINPNGSCDNIAALTNINGNVMAMMPHPERTLKGDRVFSAMSNYITAGNYPKMKYFSWPDPDSSLKAYQVPTDCLAFTISTIITDNHAASVQMALHARGIQVTVKRQIYWEIQTSGQTDMLKTHLEQSGELWNSHKEYISPPPRAPHTRSILVFERDDMLGQEKQQVLSHHFGIKNIQNIRHGILWHISSEHKLEEAMDAILESHILYNPTYHECYTY
jgi:phosphoribosylformylglycinamidine synthase I